jgi:hypothetical protein
MTQSSELAGGAGFTYADHVATRYLAALLAGSGAPGLPDRRVVRVALEQRNAGEPLDDIVVDGEAPDGSVARLGLQVKREITISPANTNKDFRDIVRDSWATLDRARLPRRGGQGRSDGRAIDRRRQVARSGGTGPIRHGQR